MTELQTCRFTRPGTATNCSWNSSSGFPFVISPETFKWTLLVITRPCWPRGVTLGARMQNSEWILKTVLSWGKRSTFPIKLGAHETNFLTILAQLQDKIWRSGANIWKDEQKAQMKEELNRKSCDVPQEASKPSLKPLTQLPGLQCCF